MFTNVEAILNQIKTDITTALTTIPNLTITLDEPIDIVYSDLPIISIYPVKEEFNFDESTSFESKKHLLLRIEIRLAGKPASTICSPVVNTISQAIKADTFLGGLANYVELQEIQWASDKTESGYISGASLDIQVDYLI